MVHSFPSGLPTFYIRLYQIVDDPSSDAIISWSKSNNSFIVWDLENLFGEILSKSVEFGRNLLQFISKLQSYGFKKVMGADPLEYGHDGFVRGQPQLLKKVWMDRKKRLAPKRAKAKVRKARAKVEHLLQDLRI
ncbi:hypothetical protein EUTSA_v10028027mg [Eutrema salsugineum]|uniref:HSF-type DNA-binding domain-containing protein n=1 Tax=Eutrema salsugineum TaxID=72664 RepID=V4M463_EUTSA|nr:hypothetical protein EUTSA_v10028027mg [Eutrema salsugineum]